MITPTTPVWAKRLLRWLHPDDTLEEVEGDLDELYAHWYRRSGRTSATLRYILNVASVLPPFVRRRRREETYSSSTQYSAMIRNYLKITFRTLVRNKLYTALNVAGLTFGISCFLLIGLYLYDELTFDHHHSHFRRIYRAIQHKKTPNDELAMAASSYKVSEESKRSIGEIEGTARINRAGRANITNPENKNTYQETITFANSGLMEMFDFEVVDGDGRTALREPNTIVIVEELALRLFNDTQVAGRTVEFDFLENKPLKVTAVLKNHPRNSSLDFKLAISEATISGDEEFAEWISDWDSPYFMTFFLLKDKADPTAIARKITQLFNANASLEPGTSLAFSLQPLADIHLYSEGVIDGARNSNVEAMSEGVLLYIRIFAVVALFVLLIACINYMNLATARASNRTKEIGVRKASGAFQSHLIHQFLTESLVVTAISFLLAVPLVNVLLPAFNRFTGKALSLGIHTDSRIWLFTLLALVVTGLLSGGYPAFLLSRFSPLSLLKNLKTQQGGSLSLRQGLVVFQFTVSVVMMVATLVLLQQVRYANRKNLGFNKELLLVVDINSGSIRREAETVKTELNRLASVKEVSAVSRVPGEWKTIPMVKIRPEGSTRDHAAAYTIGGDRNFAKTFEVQLLNGRNFIGKSDSASVLLNETAARLLGITEATGQRVEMPSRSMGGSFEPLNEANEPFRARVVGIVRDFHFQSLREKIAPMVLTYEDNPVFPIDYYVARIEGSDIPGTLAKVNAVLTKIDPTHQLEYHFLDEQLARFYADDQRRATLLIWVALATVFIACLGLFGLATYSAEQRVKEIGVRKVLGASTLNITTLLSKDFLKLVLTANGIAFPLAWWAASRWLEEFAYHIQPAWWMFAAAGVLSLVIALATVSYQAVKAALMNPVNSLRNE
jgi:putative ABC transport system permease protein